MTTLIARPLTAWPGAQTPSYERRRSPFGRATWGSTLDLLQHELRAIDVREGVVELAITERDIRLDGWVKALASPSGPGVILSFTHPEAGPLRYPCDRFINWQDNVRAIALGLEALRKVDRYGITRRGEQYAGWKAIPAKTGATLTTEQAALVLGGITGVSPAAIISARESFENARRSALRNTHPDSQGGDRERFHRAQVAIAVLDGHHRGAA